MQTQASPAPQTPAPPEKAPQTAPAGALPPMPRPSASAPQTPTPFQRPPQTFALLQQDQRLQAAAQTLCAGGLRQLPTAQATAADCLLLGPPAPTLASWLPVLTALRPGTTLFVGALGREARQQAAQLALPVVDYLDSEPLALANAVFTAEGALGILLGATPGALWQARVLLLGYGRIAQVLAPRLLALGARLRVVARSAAARTLAQALGATALDLDALPGLLPAADFVINTIPCPLLDAPLLQALPAGAFVLDLASAPGGVDAAAAQALGVRLQTAPGLPGRWAPRAAGQAIGRAVLAYLHRDTDGGDGTRPAGAASA